MTVSQNTETHPSLLRELPSEPRVKVVSGKHSICTYSPKDRNCDICLRTKITRAPCRKRTGTVVPRAEIFGDLITADHKVRNEGSESAVRCRGTRSRHSGIQSYPCKNKTKTSQQTEKSLRKFPIAATKANSHLYGQFVRIWQVLWRSIAESSNSYNSSIRDKRNCRTSCTSSKKREHQLYYFNLDWMISGGQILWNAVAICEMTKTSWQTGNLKFGKKVLPRNLSRRCFHRGW